MITILRAPLPLGLRAVLRRGEDDALTITVSSSLTAAQQRHAVREALRVAKSAAPAREVSRSCSAG